MLVIVFSYEREQMLRELLGELLKYEVIVIDDGSKWTEQSELFFTFYSFPHNIIRTNHEGKFGFWKKWVVARQIALGSNHDYFLFLPDDVSDLKLNEIKSLTEQGWDDRLFAMNLGNEGEMYRFGRRLTKQMPINLAGTMFRECGYVDGMFLTNRKTLDLCEINKVPESWFKTKEISSGVGYQMTRTLRMMNAIMMRPDESLVYHGDHESKMHKEERKKNPLITT